LQVPQFARSVYLTSPFHGPNCDDRSSVKIVPGPAHFLEIIGLTQPVRMQFDIILNGE
jgi:hypothetical protein